MHLQYINPNSTKPTLIFLHGWCCVPKDYQAQIEYFKKDYSIFIPDYSAIVLDSKSENEQIFEWCVNALKAYIKLQNLINFIVVGHSMGGIMALAMAEHFREQQIATIIIDTAMPLSPERRQNFNTLIEDLKTKQGSTILATIIDKKWINPEYDNLSLMQDKKFEMLSLWNKACDNFTQLLLAATQFDSATAIKNYSGLLLYIAAKPANGDIVALQQISSRLKIVQISSGHFIMQNAPEQLNNVLTKFLKDFANY